MQHSHSFNTVVETGILGTVYRLGVTYFVYYEYGRNLDHCILSTLCSKAEKQFHTKNQHSMKSIKNTLLQI